VSANRVLPVQERLLDSSWRSRLHAGIDVKKRDPVRVRVIAYRLKGVPGTEENGYRLVTDLFDAQAYPAAELAALYRQRCGPAHLSGPRWRCVYRSSK